LPEASLGRCVQVQDRPTAGELLDTIASLLSDDVLPLLEGGAQHKVRVAANLCRILTREAELGEALDGQERRLLFALAGPGVDSGGCSTQELSDGLADRLHAGEQGLAAEAYPAILEIVKGKLSIAKPGHDGFDFADEVAARATSESAE
jgi:hypothetical protein